MRSHPATRSRCAHPYTTPFLSCPADVLLDLGTGQELDWRVPQVVMMPAAGMAPQQAAMAAPAAPPAAGMPPQ